MKKSKYSPWFKLTDIPTRVGVYQFNDIASPYKWYRFWDAVDWHWGDDTVAGAYRNRHITVEVCYSAQWRGLVK